MQITVCAFQAMRVVRGKVPARPGNASEAWTLEPGRQAAVYADHNIYVRKQVLYP